MWKESFRIGINSIDKQHKELFDKTGELLKKVNSGVDKLCDQCVSAILYLKDYAVKHFADEEAYQKSIRYSAFDEHKKQHEKFIQTVLDHEKKMVESEFDAKSVKEFTGMLVTWLIYHVADSDQKIGKFKSGEAVVCNLPETAEDHSEIVCTCMTDTLNMMAGLDERNIKLVQSCSESFKNAVVVELDLVGDISGYITYVYPVHFIKNFVNAVMNYMPEKIGDLEISALYELSNIVSDNICKAIYKTEGLFCETTPPSLSNFFEYHHDERIYIETELGVVEADIVVEYMSDYQKGGKQRALSVR